MTFAVQADTSKVNFVKVSPSDADLAQNGPTFNLGSAPQLFKAVQDGNTLRVSLCQKGQGNARQLNGVLARVSVQLRSNVARGAVSLSAPGGAEMLPANGGPTPITIAVGTLTAQ